MRTISICHIIPAASVATRHLFSSPPPALRPVRLRPVFTRYYRELLHFLGRSVKDQHTAADLVQESYARVLVAQKNGEDIVDPRALLYRTARNLLIDRHRHDQVRRAALGETVDTDEDEETLSQLAAPPAFEPEGAVASRQGVQALLTTIGELPVRCRQAFMLHKFEGLSHAEVAEEMGITVKMVEKHIKMGLQACRACLEQQAGTAAARATRQPAGTPPPGAVDPSAKTPP